MGFKITLSILLTICFTLTSCSNESKPILKKSLPGLNTTACIPDAKKSVEKYINNTLSDEKLTEFWDCINNLIDKIVNYAEGEKTSLYSYKEFHSLIRHFLGRDEKDFNILITKGFFSLKKVLVTGTKDNLSNEELAKFKIFIDVLKKISFDLKPYAKDIIKRIQTPGTNNYEFLSTNINAAIDSSFKKLGLAFSKHKQNYSIESLEQLLTTLSLNNNTNSSFKGWGILIGQLKSLLVSPDSTKIEGTEWERFFNVLSQVTQTLISYSDKNKTEEFSSSSSLVILDKISKSIFQLLKDGLNQRETKAYENKEIFDLVDTLKTIGFLNNSETIAAPIAKQIWELFTSRFLTQKNQVFHLNDVFFIQSEFKNWSLIQKQINENKFSPPFNVPQKTKAFCLEKQKEDTPQNEFIQLIVCGPASIKLLDKTLQLDSDSLKQSPDKESMTQTNFFRILIRQVINRYGDGNTLKSRLNGLSLEKFQIFLDELAPILESMNINIEKNVFAQIDLFVLASNGDKEISFIEISQFLQYLFAGIHSSKLLTDNMTKCFTNDKKRMVERDCLKDFLINNPKTYVPGMKNLISFLTSANDKPEENTSANGKPKRNTSANRRPKRNTSTNGRPKRNTSANGKSEENTSANKQFEKQQFFENIFDITSPDPLEPGTIKVSDFSKIILLLSFIETYMVKFDSNKNGLINNAEVQKSYSLLYRRTIFDVFSPKLQGFISDDSDDDSAKDELEELVRETFTFLLLKGALPNQNDLSSLVVAQFTLWFVKPNYYKVKGSRQTISLALKALFRTTY